MLSALEVLRRLSCGSSHTIVSMATPVGIDQTATEVLQVPRPRRRPLGHLQEAGLLVVILILGVVLSVYGWYDAEPGRANTFLNFKNLLDGVATPMSYYAIMAVG